MSKENIPLSTWETSGDVIESDDDDEWQDQKIPHVRLVIPDESDEKYEVKRDGQSDNKEDKSDHAKVRS